MLAGGGLKIPFQAGVMQVWLDEAGIEFDHADGVSAACFNLAMWAQGMSGRQIADNWRNFKPLASTGGSSGGCFMPLRCSGSMPFAGRSFRLGESISRRFAPAGVRQLSMSITFLNTSYARFRARI